MVGLSEGSIPSAPLTRVFEDTQNSIQMFDYTKIPDEFKVLQGKTIKSIRWMSDKEMEQAMWHKRPVVLYFTDGTFMIPQMDDEGNNGGAIYYQGDNDYTILFTEL